MALRCVRLQRLLALPDPSLSLACRRYASSSAVFAQIRPSDVEHGTTDTPEPQDTPLDPPRRPKVQEYLNYVAENSRLTLADLESFRPDSHSPVGSPKYEVEYQTLMDKLDRSFTVNQLRQFLHLYGVHVSSKMRKQTAAATIIEKQWGWPSLSKSQKMAKAKKERSSRILSLSPQQAFLLLGKDGADILSLSQTYNVRLQFSRKPLSLTISGMTTSVNELERHVETLNEEIVWQDFDPPRPIDLSSSSQQLSRASGCFLESLPGGKIRIWYRESSKDSSSRAKRLILQHAIEDTQVPLSISPIKDEYSSFPLDQIPTYALYPYFSEPPNRPSGNKGCFRLRRVGKWFSEENNVVSPMSGGTVHGHVTATGHHASLREQLLAQLPKLDGGGHYSIAATPGHVILNSQGSQSISLVPPLAGQKPLDEVTEWVREHCPSTGFIRGTPTRFWQAPKSDRQWKHRLVYETIPGPTEQARILICEYTPQGLVGDVPVIRNQVDEVGVLEIPEPTLRSGLVAQLDLLMPDDARDLRFTFMNYNMVPATSWPDKLSDYIDSNPSFRVSDQAPLIFEYENKQYILKEDSYIQSDARPVKGDDLAVISVSERRFDLQSEESYLTYEINCIDISSNTSWGTFWNKCVDVIQDRSAPHLIEVEHSSH